jgi:hypothetical protein
VSGVPSLSGQALEEFVYLSERKLLNLARLYDEDPGWVETERTKERGASANVRFAQAGRRTTTRSEPLDPRPRDRALEALLGRMLGGPMSGLPDLDTSENGVREGEWFRFRRALRFGIGMSDSNYSVNAFVLVDQEGVDQTGFVAGLLMNGSAIHVRDPYRRDVPDDLPGQRSGSSTERLFEWLVNRDRQNEKSIEASAEAPTKPQPLRPSDAGWIAAEMYHGFARSDSLIDPRFPDIVGRGECEGVAQVSLIGTHNETTVVMASPLYVRRSAEGSFGDIAPRDGFGARLKRRLRR